MSQPFKVIVSQSLHDGGTKFYRTFDVRHVSSGVCAFGIMQWGKASPGWEMDYRIGQTMVPSESGAATELEKKRRAKRAGGYRIWDDAELAMSEEKLRSLLASLPIGSGFDRRVLEARITHFVDVDVDRASKPAAPVKSAPAPIQDESATIEGWGAW